MRRFIPYLLCALLLLGGISLQAKAGDKDFPELPNPPRLVSDFAGFLKEKEEAALEQKLVAYSDSTTNEIAVVTINSIGDYDIADYTVQLYNKWHIGGKKNNNGILMLVAREQRKIWITTGYGLEGALPDGLVGQIIRDEMEPAFKEGNFYEGIDNATDAIMDAARGEYKAEPKERHKEKNGPGTAVIIVIIIVLFIIFSRRGGGRGGRDGGLLDAAGWIALGMMNNRSRSSGWGGGGWGGSSGGGGGFGGFGGGSSGGGGAGGSW